MSKTATQIIQRALTLMDEQVTDIQSVGTDEMSLNVMAAEILPEVARSLVKDLPYELKKYLTTTQTLVADFLAPGEVQTSYAKQKVVFAAPSDFWELVALQLTVWAKPVNNYILIDSPEYAIQNNPFTRGGKQNPVVAVSDSSFGASGKFRIECFSVNSTDAKTVTIFEYISFNNVPNDTGNPWPDELFEKITKALASELNVIKGRIQEGELMGQSAQQGIEQHE